MGLVVFEAQVVLSTDYAAAPLALSAPAAAKPAAFNADDALYARGMFHGPGLQGARKLLGWSTQHLDAELRILPTQDYFSFTQSPRLQIDATLADVLGQTFYYWLQEQHGGQINCFPFGIERIALYAPPQPAGTPVLSRARVSLPAADRLAGDVEATTTDGRMLMRATNWEDRTFDVADRYYRFRLSPPQGFAWQKSGWTACCPQACMHARIAPFDNDLLAQGGGIWGRGLARGAEPQRTRAMVCAAGRWPASRGMADGPHRRQGGGARLGAHAPADGACLPPTSKSPMTRAALRPLLRIAALSQAQMPALLDLA